MLIAGLVLAAVVATHATEHLTIDSNGMEANEVNRINGKQMNNYRNGNERMPVDDEISLLSKQLKILTEQRQEDYRMLERSLHSYVQKHFEEYMNVDIKKELKDLR